MRSLKGESNLKRCSRLSVRLERLKRRECDVALSGIGTTLDNETFTEENEPAVVAKRNALLESLVVSRAERNDFDKSLAALEGC
jgi:hypothetical protein